MGLRQNVKLITTTGSANRLQVNVKCLRFTAEAYGTPNALNLADEGLSKT
jgi:hypothetical protein